jgi:ATP-dependent DNA helicase RecG
LHQLRGRVGRGGGRSFCLLVTGKMTDVARERIRAMVDTADGFQISDIDLRLRGPGEFFGTRQSGMPGLRFADLVRDAEMLDLARTAAASALESPAGAAEYEQIRCWVAANWQRRYGLVEAG